jgi:hypothetical protein
MPGFVRALIIGGAARPRDVHGGHKHHAHRHRQRRLRDGAHDRCAIARAGNRGWRIALRIGFVALAAGVVAWATLPFRARD